MTNTAIEALRTDPDYRTPGTTRGLRELLSKTYLLRLLVRKGVATRYYGSALGWVWSYLRPGAQFLMYYLVMGVVLKQNHGVEYFPIYLFAGIVAVNLFSETLRNTTASITDNRSLVRKIYMPRQLFALAACGVALVHFIPQAVLLLIVALIFGWTIGWVPVLGFFLGVLLIVLFALGLGLFFGAINAVYRDAKNFVDLILMFSTWASPVLYSFSLVRDVAPEWLYHLYMSNPMTGAVELFHDAFWLPTTTTAERPDNLVIYVLIGFGISFISLLIGQLVFRRLEGSFAQRL